MPVTRYKIMPSVYSLFGAVKCARCKLADTFRFIDWIIGFHLDLVHSDRVVSFMRLSTAERSLKRGYGFLYIFLVVERIMHIYSKILPLRYIILSIMLAFVFIKINIL